MSTYEITVNGNKYTIEVGDVSGPSVEVVVNGQRRTVDFREAQNVPAAPAPAPAAAAPAPAPQPAPEPEPAPQATPAGSVDGTVVKAPMPGKILSVRVNVGDTVSEGDTVCTLEAMKMEMPISATAGGTVKAIHINVGDNVANDDPLVTVG
ncbi:MAG: acetyl-CoA carboxylase biotin carboxyl carrier protein subunit [Chloroflexi bacterium]|nr:acetyl-CoA carboxylase biotin carboxyl carrier protein subunit [Chloroflexota bacterium]